MDAPRWPSSRRTGEAGRGWLLWLSALGFGLFALLLFFREVGTGAGVAGMLLCLTLAFYESRRLERPAVWLGRLGPALLGGLGLGSLGVLQARSAGWLAVLDGRDQLTPEGMVLFWGFFLVGMGLVARQSGRRAASEADGQCGSSRTSSSP